MKYTILTFALLIALFAPAKAQTTTHCQVIPHDQSPVKLDAADATATILSCEDDSVLVIPRGDYRFLGAGALVDMKRFPDGRTQFLPGAGLFIFRVADEVATCKQGIFDDQVVFHDRRSENGPPRFDCDRFWREVSNINDVVPYYWLRTVQQ